MGYALAEGEWSIIRPILPSQHAKFLAVLKLAAIWLWLTIFESTS